MKIKSFLAKPYAAYVKKKIQKDAAHAVQDQLAIMRSLVNKAATTRFGRDHQFSTIKTYEDFKQHIPIVDYEQFKSYIELIKEGAEHVCWKGKPLYFAKTSGTTSGVKYIPISKDSISNHIDTAKFALLNYMAETGNSSFADGKLIFLSGSPVMDRVAGIPTGRLSGIVNHFIPAYLRKNQLPSFETNCIEDWEQKLGHIVAETQHQDMRLISGIPPWMQMYFDWLQEKNPGKTIRQLFPNLQVLVYGGVNFEPYRAKLMQSIGETIDTIETFPASEGFFAFQDQQGEKGLLLNTNSGIFFEFIPADEIFNDQPTRYNLSQVELGINYALIINSNAGLWGYNIGDTVKFVSKDPYRIIVSGRIKHFISAFGEHVIGEEVEYALAKGLAKVPCNIIEFTVAPMIQVAQGLPYHEWLIAFEQVPENLEQLAKEIDMALQEKNVYYKDLLSGGILQTLQIRVLKKDAFIQYMKAEGKLGGQNKVPRLSNDRKIAEALLSL